MTYYYVLHSNDSPTATIQFIPMLLGGADEPHEKGDTMPIIGKHKWIRILVSICLVCCAWLIFFVWHINGTRIIADETLPDGTRFIVTQKCNWGGEPFTTACYYQKPGKNWGWYYYDHEDWYWNHAPTRIDQEAKQLSVLRNGKTTVTFNWETEAFTLWRFKPPRLFVGPQSWQAANWQPPQ